MKDFVLRFLCGLMVSLAVGIGSARAIDTSDDDKDSNQEQAESMKKAQEEMRKQQESYNAMSNAMKGLRETSMNNIRGIQ